MRKGFLLGGPVAKKPEQTKNEQSKPETPKKDIYFTLNDFLNLNCTLEVSHPLTSKTNSVKTC